MLTSRTQVPVLDAPVVFKENMKFCKHTELKNSEIFHKTDKEITDGICISNENNQVMFFLMLKLISIYATYMFS